MTPSTATNGNASNDMNLSINIGDTEAQAQPAPSAPRRSTDRRRNRVSRLTFSFTNITNSITSTGSAISSILSERSASFNDEEADARPARSSSQESVVSADSHSASSGSKKLRLFNSSSGSNKEAAANSASAARKAAIAFRRYNVGDYVLISNHELPANSEKLVNLHGFAEWDADETLLLEELRGPFVYLLAQVTRVHFLGNVPSYTVARMDNGDEQRADVGEMRISFIIDSCLIL